MEAESLPASERFTIIIDTREQSPWTFEGYHTLRSPLPAGDYSVDGLISYVAIERKSLHDFVQTIIHNRERFRRECVKLAGMHHACIIVEASVQDVKLHHYKSRAKPNSVLGIAEGIERQFQIPILWAGNRFGAICKALDWLNEGWQRFGG